MRKKSDAQLRAYERLCRRISQEERRRVTRADVRACERAALLAYPETAMQVAFREAFRD